MATKKDKSPKEEFKKKAPKAKKPKTAPKKEKEQPYTGGANWCGTMSRNRRRWGGGGTPSGESW